MMQSALETAKSELLKHVSSNIHCFETTRNKEQGKHAMRVEKSERKTSTNPFKQNVSVNTWEVENIISRKRVYLLDFTADPVSFSFLSAANIAAIVLSDTWSLWSTDFTFSLTTEIPIVNFSVSPTLRSKEVTFSDALALNRCFSSNALALFIASWLIAEPFASTLVTTSCALLT